MVYLNHCFESRGTRFFEAVQKNSQDVFYRVKKHTAAPRVFKNYLVYYLIHKQMNMKHHRCVSCSFAFHCSAIYPVISLVPRSNPSPGFYWGLLGVLLPHYWQCGPVVRVLALRSGDPGISGSRPALTTC